MTDPIFICTIIVLLVLIIVVIFCKIDTLADKVDILEYKINKTIDEVDVCTKKYPHNMNHKTRLDRLQTEINFLTHRLDNLPSEKAKVIQQKVDELEEMVKELK